MSELQPVAELGYAEALTELETILDRLEHDEPDVDRVAVDVSRAAELVEHCRGRIASARLRVQEVVADLAPETAPEPDGAVAATNTGEPDSEDAG